jgi:hypothetical protein
MAEKGEVIASPILVSVTAVPPPANANAASIRLVIKSMTSKQHTVEVHPSDTVGTLKKKHQEQTGIPARQQRYFFSAQRLNNEVVLSAVEGLDDGATIHMMMQKPSVENVSVTIVHTDKSPSVLGNTIEFSDLPEQETIGDIKQRIESSNGISSEQQLLWFVVPEGFEITDPQVVANIPGYDAGCPESMQSRPLCGGKNDVELSAATFNVDGRVAAFLTHWPVGGSGGKRNPQAAAGGKPAGCCAVS